MAYQAWHTAEYRAYLASDEWQAFRRRLFAKRGYRCEGCGLRKLIQGHHANYDRLGNELESDVVLVCPKCHRNIHEAFNAGKFETLEEATRWIIERAQRRSARHQQYAKLPLIGWLWR